jgi:hypothetical protein
LPDAIIRWQYPPSRQLGAMRSLQRLAWNVTLRSQLWRRIEPPLTHSEVNFFVASDSNDKRDKKDDSFRVVDKRLFTPEGVLRQDVADEQDREHERGRAQEAAKAQAAAKTPAATNPPGTPGTPSGAAAAAGGEASAIPPSRGFQMIVEVLARNAELMLGGIPDPRTGQTYMDLEGAREMIDMLDALQEKTRGNLGREDADLLRDVTGSLKLTFMQLSKAAAEAIRAKAQAAPPSKP